MTAQRTRYPRFRSIPQKGGMVYWSTTLSAEEIQDPEDWTQAVAEAGKAGDIERLQGLEDWLDREDMPDSVRDMLRAVIDLALLVARGKP